MIEYKYKKVKGYDQKKFTENGHTMFETDVLRRLERLAYLEENLKDKVLLPKSLTAENGVKGLLIGEFNETIRVDNPDYCEYSCDCGDEDCDDCQNQEEVEGEYIIHVIPVEWTTIKDIYKKIVEHFK